MFPDMCEDCLETVNWRETDDDKYLMETLINKYVDSPKINIASGEDFPLDLEIC